MAKKTIKRKKKGKKKGKKGDESRVVSIYLNSFQLKTISGLMQDKHLNLSDSIKEFFISQGKIESVEYKTILSNQVKMIEILEGIKRFQPVINLTLPESQPKPIGFWSRLLGK